MQPSLQFYPSFDLGCLTYRTKITRSTYLCLFVCVMWSYNPRTGSCNFWYHFFKSRWRVNVTSHSWSKYSNSHWRLVMDNLKISKLDRFFCDFRSEFLLYRLRHFSDACPWSITNGRPIRRSVRSAHIKRSENLTRARSDSDSCVAATRRVRLTDAFTTVPLTASISHHSNTSAVLQANGWERGEGRECSWSADFTNLRYLSSVVRCLLGPRLHSVYALATPLDPRYKLHLFAPDELEAIKQWAIEFDF